MCVECECRGECESACTRMRASASARDKISREGRSWNLTGAI